MSQFLHWLLPSTDRPAKEKTAEHNANLAFASLRNGDWQQARKLFSPFPRYIMTEKMLEKGWRFTEVAFGKFKHHGPPTCSVGWLFTTVTVPVSFSRVNMIAKMHMTPSGGIFSLKLSPVLVSEWHAPCYAPHPDEMREIKRRFGKGLFTVGGTITLPAESSKCPCVILISGSGPLSRDSDVGALKPFKDLALGLAQQGIATCRLDKVTYTYRLWYMLNRCGARRMTLLDEYAQVFDAIRYISRHPDVDSNRVYVLGHSLGGLVAAHAAATETLVAGCILMAAPHEAIYRCAIRQYQYLASIEDDEELTRDILSDAEGLEAKAALADSPDLSPSTPAEKLPFGIGPGYWLECRKLRVQETVKRLQKPVLVLQGSRDYQIDMVEYEKLRASLGGSDAEFRVFEGLNHCFVMGEGTPSPADYHKPGSVSVEAIEEIARWTEQIPQ
ncbi:Alpha/Beta hydrolase protein [Aspergillus karnatakaensis]|uniref:Alpha/Beta hydrolase protein n=1 Tax=Aspergillus karnatakaensis TaxID=1810916 RepID=UPI003CCDAF93